MEVGNVDRLRGELLRSRELCKVEDEAKHDVKGTCVTLRCTLT
jgi:hypothetical protein